MISNALRISMFFCFSLVVGLSQMAYGNKDIPYHKATLQKGDGAISLLNRYKLGNNTCNLSEFHKINNLKQNSILRADVAYNVPIKIYAYNNTSIRSTIGIDNWDIALAIQQYNKDLQTLGLKPAYYTVDKRLFVPHHLIACNTENTTTIETRNTIINAPLFGSYSKVEKKSDKLDNQVFYIMSGHGGPDPGAMKKKGASYLCEDEYAYDVSLRLAKNLMEQGAIVHMIIQDKNDGIRDQQILPCDKDERSISNQALPLSQLARLKQRTVDVNRFYKKEKKNGREKHTVIAIHVDSRSMSKQQDVFFYYSPGSTKGRKLALKLQNKFKEKYKIHRPNTKYAGSIAGRGLYVLKKTNPPAVYIELANIQNINDQKRILQTNNRQAVANWLYEGLTGLTY